MTIHEFLEGPGIVSGAPDTCSICRGEPVVAVHHCDYLLLGVCADCALRVLPKLILDAARADERLADLVPRLERQCRRMERIAEDIDE